MIILFKVFNNQIDSFVEYSRGVLTIKLDFINYSWRGTAEPSMFTFMKNVHSFETQVPNYTTVICSVI